MCGTMVAHHMKENSGPHTHLNVPLDPKSLQLSWISGASFGLTPFWSNFIDYVACAIPVRDVTKVNIVIGIGTTLHKFTDTKGFLVKKYPLCVSCHLQWFSPHTNHRQMHGDYSEVSCNCIKMLFITSKVQIQIMREVNLPVVLYLTQENDGFYYALWLLPHPSISRPLPMNVCPFRVHWPLPLFALSMQSMCWGIWEWKTFLLLRRNFSIGIGHWALACIASSRNDAQLA